MLQPGTIFDTRYELVRKIGKGGFAEVWLAKDTLADLHEALKIYAPGEGLDEDGWKIFKKELAVVHDIHHSHILTPKLLAQYESQPYLVLQYCPNGSLKKYIGQCTEEQAWRILEQVASGLAYLHKRNIVHQDIKPDNILVDANSDCMITDFGISLRAQSTLRKSMRDQANYGTRAYMAPERFSAEPHPIPASDIWSLGAMMFELIEREVPFEEDGGVKQKKGADIPTMHANVSDNLKRVIRSMLALNAADRPTAAQLVEVAKSRSTLQLPPEPDINQKPQEESPSHDDGEGSSSAEKKARIIGSIVVLIILIVVGILGYLDQHPNRTGSKEANPEDTVATHDQETSSSMEEPKYRDDKRRKEEEARKIEEARKASLKSQGWVDLGLPSGTLWKDKNVSSSFYTYSEAVKKFGNNLPSKKQLDELSDKCRWTWIGDGYKVIGPNGNHIFLPAVGARDCEGNINSVGCFGGYWSRTSGSAIESAWYLDFGASEVDVYDDDRCYGLSVRLVR